MLITIRYAVLLFSAARWGSITGALGVGSMAAVALRPESQPPSRTGMTGGEKGGRKGKGEMKKGTFSVEAKSPAGTQRALTCVKQRQTMLLQTPSPDREHD
jgi:hypothetical protein